MTVNYTNTFTVADAEVLRNNLLWNKMTWDAVTDQNKCNVLFHWVKALSNNVLITSFYPLCITGIHYISYLYYLYLYIIQLFSIVDQINAALVNGGDFFKKYFKKWNYSKPSDLLKKRSSQIHILKKSLNKK